MTEAAPQSDRSAVVAPTTRSELLELLRRSEIVDSAALDRWLNGNTPPGDETAIGLGAALVRARLLTDWQREKLLEGRWKGFFLGKYKILSRLGAGAMGRVYLAEHRVMRRRVALKVLAKRLSGREAYIQRFQQEARAAAAVNSPRIVKAFDIDCEEEMHFLVMEYVDGVDLQKVVQRDGPLPIQQAAELVRQIAEGLEAVHRAGLIHRDIKPANVLLDREGQIHVLDLGLARLTDSDEPSLTLVHDTKLIGTVDYLAPEQARNSHDIDHRADLYSLGGTMYFLLTGRPPFNEGTLPQRVAMHLTQPPTEIRQLRRDVPDEVARVCHRLLEKDPNRRYQRGAEVVADLLAFLEGTPRPSQPEPTLARRPPTDVDDGLKLADFDAPTRSSARPGPGSGAPSRSIAARAGATANPASGASSRNPSAASNSSSSRRGPGAVATPRSSLRRNQPSHRGTGSDVLSPSQLSGGNRSEHDLAAATPDNLAGDGDTFVGGGGDSLAGLLEEVLPEALAPLTPSQPLAGAGASAAQRSTLAPSASAIQRSAGQRPGSSTGSTVAAQPSAVVHTPPAAAPQSLNAYEALLRKVTSGEGDMGGFTYRTWFLVLLGLLIGGIIGFVILHLFAGGSPRPYKGGFEQPAFELPGATPRGASPSPLSATPAGPAGTPPPAPPSLAAPDGSSAAPPPAPALPSATPRRGRRED